MSYNPPISADNLLTATKRFRRYFFSSIVLIALTLISVILFDDFFKGKTVWTFGSLLTLYPVIANRYFDIKKTANKSNQEFNLINIENPALDEIKCWLNIEKITSYVWVLGTILLIISKWCD